jgi:hypothetical protein
LMNRGNSAPVLAAVWAMKWAACCRTRRYSVVCSGRWRSWWSGRGGAGRAAHAPSRAGRRWAFDTVGVRRSPGPRSVARVAQHAYPRRGHSDGGLRHQGCTLSTKWRRPSTLLCHAPAAGRLRHPYRARTPGPRGRVHHDDLHRCAQPGRTRGAQPARPDVAAYLRLRPQSAQ